MERYRFPRGRDADVLGRFDQPPGPTQAGDTHVSAIVRVPPELDAFLRLPNPQSLIIRGPPGSGKTMLSLALMETYPGRRVYVSLRISRASLLTQIPWLGEIPPGEVEIIDVARESDRPRMHPPKTPGPDLLVAEPPESKELAEFLWLPQAVQAAWSLTDNRVPTLMVFDSWDAVVDQYFERVAESSDSGPSRSRVERLLLERMARGNISLVLVLERDSPSVLDYQVNGIVETFRQVEEGRLERWLRVPKLRGVPVNTDTYPFTLARGRFSALTANRPGDHYRLQAPCPDPSPSLAGLWPGSTDFADSLGRLRFGALTLFEIDTAVPREVSRVILGPMIINALRLGGRVLILPPPSLDPEDSYVTLREHLPAQVIQEQLRVLSSIPLSEDGEELSEVFVPFQKIRWTKTGLPVPIPEDPEYLQAALGSKGPNLIVAHLSGLEALTEAAGVTLIRGVLSGLARTVFHRNPVHVAAVGRTDDGLFAGVASTAETHIRIRSPHGRIFVNGHRPYLAPMVLSQESGPEPYHLTTVL